MPWSLCLNIFTFLFSTVKSIYLPFLFPESTSKANFFLGKGHFQGVEKEGYGMKAKKSDVEFIRGSFNEPLIQTWKSFRFLVEFMQASLTLISGIQTQ